ncbi:MAG: hypothetical protein AM325_005885 [Candidatus Thorarchaeota archaeon SMTZ1-45]|nr:MAG: hypothetical protein AM325_07635 [Candidatus Thorarchaeota archaeon SMTZ1-45]
MGNLVLLLIQSPFDIPLPDTWFSTLGEILNALFALAIRGYLIFILIGMMIYATGLSDGLAKSLVAAGIVLFFGGPLIINLLAQLSGVETITVESATSAWLHLLGMTDAEIISILVWLGDAIVAICLLAGAILYFTPSANDMTGKGKSLIVRALLLAPILAFFHVAAWL